MLANATNLVQLIKQAALDAVEAKKPIHICYGKVMGISPIQILVEQKLLLGKGQLVLCRNVTDFSTEVTINWTSDSKSGGGGEAAFASHAHTITGRKKITVHNGLVVGDEVLLIRQQGGQKYIVVDKIG